MKMTRKISWTLLLAAAVSFTQCKDAGDDVQIDDENELITSVTLKFTEEGTNNTTSFSYKDADGDGGNAPARFDTIALKPNKTYTLAIELLDESKTPASNITDEVAEESDEHLFVYTPAPSTLLTYTYGDKDANNYVIGLTGKAVTTVAGTGTLKVRLRHQPGTKNGTPSPGSDDVNLDFILKVQ
ncbi:hypothetical protein MUK70_19330 [Dyadobacter chenwenxiniae]|uniref:Type 1 periplasmic binding fold superfamily protein n=1 Tax=Dyadobacter chenwenxiniae TaxID=2906456 RepID=A0A9X1TKN5_9BACT|nr:hypothetical protein [Dyadobacter chenwenxiniae]MCF0061393.1 hypothetical protein [Dyadobacter chenwenxiniae]UON81215.1 hypothetical protein MUK70_19330 [Dyadobacter chenwenxiniae]